MVLLSGEAGIGKSAPGGGAARTGAGAKAMPALTLRCSPYHTNSALYPVIEHVQQAAAVAARRSPPKRSWPSWSRALQTSRLPLRRGRAPVGGPAGRAAARERYPPLHAAPQQQRQQTQDALVAWMLEEAERQPVLVVWEDLHWADPSTLELLGLLLDRPHRRHAALLTFRPEFSPALADPLAYDAAHAQPPGAPAGRGADHAPGGRQDAAGRGGGSILWPRPMGCRCSSKS